MIVGHVPIVSPRCITQPHLDGIAGNVLGSPDQHTKGKRTMHSEYDFFDEYDIPDGFDYRDEILKRDERNEIDIADESYDYMMSFA